jgi:hypothetical protein
MQREDSHGTVHTFAAIGRGNWNNMMNLALASRAPYRREEETPMVKATKLTLAAALLAGSASLAFAQAGAGGEPPKASDANPPAATKMTPGESKSAPAQGAQAPSASGHKQVQTPKAPTAAGSETGTARDTAGAGANVKAAGSGNAEQGKMKTKDTHMPAGSNNSTGNMNTKGAGKGTTGTGSTGGSGNR